MSDIETDPRISAATAATPADAVSSADAPSAPIVITLEMREMMRVLNKKIDKARPMMAQIASGELKVLTEQQARQRDLFPEWKHNLEMLAKGLMPPKNTRNEDDNNNNSSKKNNNSAAAANKKAPPATTTTTVAAAHENDGDDDAADALPVYCAAANSISDHPNVVPGAFGKVNYLLGSQGSSPSPARGANKKAAAGGRTPNTVAKNNSTSAASPHNSNKRIATAGVHTMPDGEVIEIPKDISNLAKKLVEMPKKVQKVLIDLFVKKQLDTSKLASITKEYDDLCKLRRDILVGKIAEPTKAQENRLKLIDIVKKEMSIENERLKAQGERIRLTIKIEYGERMALLYPQRQPSSDDDEGEAELEPENKEADAEEAEVDGQNKDGTNDDADKLEAESSPTTAKEDKEENEKESGGNDNTVTAAATLAEHFEEEKEKEEEATPMKDEIDEPAEAEAEDNVEEKEIAPPAVSPAAVSAAPPPVAAAAEASSSSDDDDAAPGPMFAAGGGGGGGDDDEDGDGFGFDLFDAVAHEKEAKKALKAEKKKKKADEEANKNSKKDEVPEIKATTAAVTAEDEEVDEEEATTPPPVAAAPKAPEPPKEIDWSMLKVIRNRIALHQKVITAEDKDRLDREQQEEKAMLQAISNGGIVANSSNVAEGKKGGGGGGGGRVGIAGRRSMSAAAAAAPRGPSNNGSGALRAPSASAATSSMALGSANPPAQMLSIEIDDAAIEAALLALKTEKKADAAGNAADDNKTSKTKNHKAAAAASNKTAPAPSSSAAATSNNNRLGTIHAALVQRVQRELMLCYQNPLANVRVAVATTDANTNADNSILTWYVNVSPTQGPMAGVIIPHLIQFGDLYPQQPPLVRCLVSVPHSGIVLSDLYRDVLCFEHTRPAEWSPAHGVGSILMQLQSFYNEENFAKIRDVLKAGPFKQRIAIARADCTRYSNPTIGHFPAHPYPPVPVFNGPFEAKATLKAPTASATVTTKSSEKDDSNNNKRAPSPKNKSGGDNNKSKKEAKGGDQQGRAAATSKRSASSSTSRTPQPRGEVLQGPGSATWLHSYNASSSSSPSSSLLNGSGSSAGGVHIFKVHVFSDKPRMIIGVAAPNGATGDRVGSDEYGWGFSTADMSLRHKGKPIDALALAKENSKKGKKNNNNSATTNANSLSTSNANNKSDDEEESNSTTTSPAQSPSLHESTSSPTTAAASAAASGNNLKVGDTIVFTIDFGNRTLNIALLTTTPTALTAGDDLLLADGVTSQPTVVVVPLFTGVPIPHDLDALVPTIQISDRSMVILELNMHTKSLAEYEATVLLIIGSGSSSSTSTSADGSSAVVDGPLGSLLLPQNAVAAATTTALPSSSTTVATPAAAAGGIRSRSTVHQQLRSASIKARRDESVKRSSDDKKEENGDYSARNSKTNTPPPAHFQQHQQHSQNEEAAALEAARKPVRCVMTLATAPTASTDKDNVILGVVVSVGRDPKTFMPTAISFKDAEYVSLDAFPQLMPKRGGQLVGRRREALIVLPLTAAHAKRPEAIAAMKNSFTMLCRNPDASTSYTPPFKPQTVWPVIAAAVRSILEEPSEDRGPVARLESYFQMQHLLSAMLSVADTATAKVIMDAARAAASSPAAATDAPHAIIGAAAALFPLTAEGNRQLVDLVSATLVSAASKNSQTLAPAEAFQNLTRQKKKLIATAAVYASLVRKDAEDAFNLISQDNKDAASAFFEGICGLEGTFTEASYLRLQPLLDDVMSYNDIVGVLGC